MTVPSTRIGAAFHRYDGPLELVIRDGHALRLDVDEATAWEIAAVDDPAYRALP